MSTNLQNENERRLDQLMTIVEDRLSTKTLDPEEEKHLRYRNSCIGGLI
jgi:hypothetical protein